jgi:hypothetical protein
VKAPPADAELAEDQLGDFQITSDEVTESIKVEAGKLITADKIKAIDRVKAVQEGMRNGFFSHGLEGDVKSNPGHSSHRIDELLGEPQWVGDDEQYAVLMSLMLNSMGIPARVVMGFHTDKDSILHGGTWTVTGNDVHAWVEVPFEAAGWVAFDAAPDKDKEPADEQPKPQNNPKPQVLQPPISPEEPEELPPDPMPDDQEKEENENPFNWEALLFWTGAIGIPLILILGPPAALILAKRRRRSARLRSALASDRIAGGWREILDAAADLGAVLPRSATRLEMGKALAAHFDNNNLVNMARWADRSVFAAGEPADAEAMDYWAGVDTLRQQLLVVKAWPKKVGAKLSLTSLRRRPAPTLEMEKR